MTGKPYSGKLNVRFDEGELEIGHLPLRQFSTLPKGIWRELIYALTLFSEQGIDIVGCISCTNG